MSKEEWKNNHARSLKQVTGISLKEERGNAH